MSKKKKKYLTKKNKFAGHHPRKSYIGQIKNDAKVKIFKNLKEENTSNRIEWKTYRTTYNIKKKQQQNTMYTHILVCNFYLVKTFLYVIQQSCYAGCMFVSLQVSFSTGSS